MGEFEQRHLFKELTTKKDLMDEGVVMHHCVGGYGEPVKDGRCMIFHIGSPFEDSTLEISARFARDGNKELYIVQHKGKFNTEPTFHHKELARCLIQHLGIVSHFPETCCCTRNKTVDTDGQAGGTSPGIQAMLAKLRAERASSN